MQWFQGSIAEAIATAKTRNAIFIVYIRGPSNDEASTKTSASLEDAQVSAALNSSEAVAITLENGTEACKQFSQIYPLVLVPSLFFIRAINGIPVEVIGGPLEPQTLLSKINSAFDKHREMDKSPSLENQPQHANYSSQETVTNASSSQSGPSASHSQSEQISMETSTNLSQSGQPLSETLAPSSHSEQTSSGTPVSLSHTGDDEPQRSADDREATTESLQARVDNAKRLLGEHCPSADDNEISQSNETGKDTSVVQGDAEDNSTKTESTVLPLEERVQRAKKLLAEKREQKEAEENQKEQHKEIERRKMGQQVQKAQRRQEEGNLQKMAEERRKERAEEKAARERIRQQIAQDRAERAMKWNTEREAEERKKKEQETKKLAEQQVQAAAVAAARSNVAHIQFRLPDGSSHTTQFPADNTMAVIQAYVRSNLKLPFRDFTLSTTFPKRMFSAEDDQKNLRELQLAPSSVVLILPAQSTSIEPSTGGVGIMSLFWYLLSPVVFVLNFLKSSIFGASQSSSKTSQKRKVENSDEINEPSASESTENRPRTAYKRRTVPQPQFRQEGNIHRLGRHSDDDDNNTWNGNSTQQM